MAELFEDDFSERKEAENDPFEIEFDTKDWNKQTVFDDDVDPFKYERDEESDEDIKLFIKNRDDQDTMNPKLIQGIIIDAQKRFKSKLEMEERRNKRLERTQQYYFSRSYILIQIGRCLKIANLYFGELTELITAQLMSILYINFKPPIPIDISCLSCSDIMILF